VKQVIVICHERTVSRVTTRTEELKGCLTAELCSGAQEANFIDHTVVLPRQRSQLRAPPEAISGALHTALVHDKDPQNEDIRFLQCP
jgi:hypothetical protein